jgi:hypothetical protein
MGHESKSAVLIGAKSFRAGFGFRETVLFGIIDSVGLIKTAPLSEGDGRTDCGGVQYMDDGDVDAETDELEGRTRLGLALVWATRSWEVGVKLRYW